MKLKFYVGKHVCPYQTRAIILRLFSKSMPLSLSVIREYRTSFNEEDRHENIGIPENNACFRANYN